MSILRFPFINGRRYDFGSLSLLIAGIPQVIGIESINYSDRLEPTKVRGTHAAPIGRTRGQYEAEASITLYKEEGDLLIRTLAPLSGLARGYMEVPFQIIVNYADDGAPIITDVIEQCRIKSASDSHSQGTEALKVTFDLDVMRILRNGATAIGNPLI